MSRDDGIARIVQVAQRLEHERAAAKPHAAELRQGIATWWADVPSEWRTVGFAQEVAAASAEIIETDARMALALAQYAIVVITSVAPEASYPSLVRAEAEATAWKELANAHRYLSEYDAAIRALDAGDRCLSNEPALGHDRAVLGFARALVYCDQRRFSLAGALLRESIQAFQDFGDLKRVGQCLILRGMIEQRRGQLVEACVSYDEAASVIRKTDDLYGLACIYNNIAQARIDLGHTDAAVSALQDALGIFTELAMPGEIARVRWVLGRVMLNSGGYQQARTILSEARVTFLSLRMPEEAGLVGFELAEAHLALDRIENARMVIEEVAGEFIRAGLNERALTALAYLRDELATDRARAAVRHVKRYVEQLREEPLREFVPLPFV